LEENDAIGKLFRSSIRSGRWRRPVIGHLKAEGQMHSLRIPVKATTLSGAWRPRDPVDDDQGGARVCWRRWIYFLISVFEVRGKR
jgi:hypothetical protein